ncbi:MAG: TlpA family protein disulfide reductase, partial [bacterium]
LVVAGVGGYFGWQRFEPRAAPADATLAQIELPDIDKNLRRGSEWLGQVVLVNHWATWCPPCREEIPLLIETQRRLGEYGLQVVGVAHDVLDEARAFSDRIGLNYPSLVATDGGALMRLQGNDRSGALPFTVLFDREGKLVGRKLGKLSEAELHRMVLSVL